MGNVVIRTLEGLTAAEYEALKTAAKDELTVPHTLRFHKQGYCYGAVDIRPTAKTGYRFTEAQAAEVIEFCIRRGLGVSQAHLFTQEHGYC